MDIVKSLFENHLSKLKFNQRESFLIKDSECLPLKIDLVLPPTQEILDSLYKTFMNCNFYKLGMVLEFDDSNIRCVFINLDAINYNPFEDCTTLKLLNVNLELLKNRNLIPPNIEYFKVSSTSIKKHRHVSAKSKYELLLIMEKMVTMFLKYYEIMLPQRLSIYETDQDTLVIEISILLHKTELKNELYLDELYFLILRKDNIKDETVIFDTLDTVNMFDYISHI